MLRVAYIATEPPAVKPKQLTYKQRVREAALETLAVRRHQDELNANLKFKDMEEALDREVALLRRLIKEKNLNPKDYDVNF